MSEQTTAVRSLDEIDRALVALQQERELVLKNESKQALAQVKQIIAKFGFTAEQLFSETKIRTQAAAKYKDPETDKTWSGRGREPKWFNSEEREKFLIKDSGQS